MDEAGRAAERVARESYGRLVAFLAARTRDVAGAEDALADAFARALRAWRDDGVPNNPDAWLLTTARHRQTDTARQLKTREEGAEEVGLIADEMEAMAAERDAIPDRRLALMFACSHPAIERGMRTPLILQTILGLTAKDIATAFLLPPATIGQRLSRAKARIRDAGIPFRVPEPGELPERLAAVLDAIYAAYTKGWSEVADDGIPELADEAIWLGQLVVSLLPDEPETKGMLALMLYTAARSAARRDASGAFVPLERQDTKLWDGSSLALAESLMRQANSAGPSGRYQAAINDVVRAITAAGGEAIAAPADCTNGAALAEARDEVQRNFGAVDIVAAFAGGLGTPTSFLQVSEESWRASVDENLTATFLTIRTFASTMVERKRGAIVTMSSSAGRVPGLASPPYAASKAGIVMLTGHLARELAPLGVRVNCIAPSAIMNDRLARLPPEKLHDIAAGFPLGRIGVPDDVALATLYLVSESSSWVTGVTLDVSGGRVIV